MVLISILRLYFAVSVNTNLDECYHEDRSAYTAFCKMYPYNISCGFDWNYFSAMNCCCYAKPCQLFYSYCARLKHCFNFKVKTACVPTGQKLSFNIWPISSYLQEKIKASPLFCFDKIKNIVIVRLDEIDYGDVFVWRDTANF